MHQQNMKNENKSKRSQSLKDKIKIPRISAL